MNQPSVWTKLRRILFFPLIPSARAKKPVIRMLVDILTFIIILYLGLCLFAIVMANSLIFPAPKPSYEEIPGQVKLPLPDGNEIVTLYLPNSNAEYTLMYNHGNGEDLGLILPMLQEFHKRGFAVLAYDYPGYGQSDGKPSENGVYAAAAAAYTYAVIIHEVDPDKIILYGRSLGSGPAVDLAAKKPVAGLIIDGGFASTFRVMTRWQILPWDKFDNISKMDRVQCPTLIIHGMQDRTVPFRHAKMMEEAATKHPQTLYLDEAGHNNLVELAGADYWDAILYFRSQLP